MFLGCCCGSPGGCGRKLAEAKGKVTYKGRPLELSGCQIAFLSTGQEVFLGAPLKDVFRPTTTRLKHEQGRGR